MKHVLLFALVLSFAFSPNYTVSQEWNNLKSYKKETGFTSLQKGCWLKKDRKQQTKVWHKANEYNLSKVNANLKYKTISQIRDFYLWFDSQIKKQGHEVYGVGIAAIAAGQLSKLDSGIIRVFIVRNKEIVAFANTGSQNVFKYAFPLMKDIYFSDVIITGAKAKNWSLQYGEVEQCDVLEPLYNKLSKKALSRLEKMAKGKGIFNLAVPKRLKYVGSLKDCQSRFKHGVNKLLPFYLKSSN